MKTFGSDAQGPKYSVAWLRYVWYGLPMLLQESSEVYEANPKHQTTELKNSWRRRMVDVPFSSVEEPCCSHYTRRVDA